MNSTSKDPKDPRKIILTNCIEKTMEVKYECMRFHFRIGTEHFALEPSGVYALSKLLEDYK